MAEKSNRLVVVLGIGLMMALLVIAFLLGRLWLLPETPGSSAATGDPVATSTPPTDGLAADAAGRSGPGQLRVEHREGGIFITNDAPKDGAITEKDGQIWIAAKGQPQPEPDVAPAGSPAGPASAVQPKAPSGVDVRQQVLAYLNQVDALQTGPLGINPRKFSESMAMGIANGKLDDFDKLIEDVDGVEEQLSALDPPDPCQQLHVKLVEVTKESREMLAEIRESLTHRNTTRLQLINTRAQALQAKIQVVEGLQEQIRRQYAAY
jgi:hypothetical protein